MKTYFTVLVFARYKGKYLVLQRAKHRSDPGDWNGVSGYIKERESAEETAIRELKEETNLEGEIISETEPFWRVFGDTRWVCIAFIVDVENIENLVVDKMESSKYDWIAKNDPRVEKYEAIYDSFKNLNIL